MDGFYNLCKRKQIFMVMFLMIGSCVQISIATSDSCPISPSTVKFVDGCPDTEEEWREAAAKKNCSAYASQCDEPDKLVYHCVINAFVNQTLEVCAYWRIIVLGFCTEYSFGGNIIQQNIRTNCTKFTQSPCPSGYPSTDAYKYPGCYELTKKETTSGITTLSTINTTQMNGEKQANEEMSYEAIVVPILVCLVIIIVVLILLNRHQKHKCPFFEKKDCRDTPEIVMKETDYLDTCTALLNSNEEESLHSKITEPMDSETDKKHIAPSGKCIQFGSGEKMKDIKPFEEDAYPERFLNAEEDPEEDCQDLLSLLNDGFERLAMSRSEISSADNQPSLENLHHDYYDPNLRISQESTKLLKKDLAEVEFLTSYFNKPRNKQHICKE